MGWLAYQRLHRHKRMHVLSSPPRMRSLPASPVKEKTKLGPAEKSGGRATTKGERYTEKGHASLRGIATKTIGECLSALPTDMDTAMSGGAGAGATESPTKGEVFAFPEFKSQRRTMQRYQAFLACEVRSIRESTGRKGDA